MPIDHEMAVREIEPSDLSIISANTHIFSTWARTVNFGSTRTFAARPLPRCPRPDRRNPSEWGQQWGHRAPSVGACGTEAHGLQFGFDSRCE